MTVASDDDARAGLNAVARRRRIWRPLGIAGGLLGCGVVAVGFTPVWNFLAAALAGSSLIVGWVPARRPPFAAVSVCSAVAFLLWASSAAEPLRGMLPHVATIVALIGIGATAALIVTRSGERLAIVGATGIPAFVVLTGLLLVRISVSLPLTYDAYLLAADRSLGVVPAYEVGRWFQQHPTLALASGLPYMTLPLEVALVYAASSRGLIRGVAPGKVLLICAAAGIAGAVAYCVYPAAGPRLAFPGFPAPPGDLPIELIAVTPGAPRNAMPSLHLAWSLLLWRLARGGPFWTRLLTTFWLAGTVLATLGLGEHYAVDLVVSVPFALAIEAVCVRRAHLLAAANLAAVAAWIIALRQGAPPNGTAIWWGSAITLLLGYVLGRELDRGLSSTNVGSTHSSNPVQVG
jgi:hypothetical protein